VTTTHEPGGYDCPFCRLQAGIHDERNQPGDVVAVTERAFARVSPRWWSANPGALLVIPRRHVENLYDLPDEDGHAVWDLTRLVAKAVRATYGCDGTSIRQHNEPAGGQDVWPCTSTSSPGMTAIGSMSGTGSRRTSRQKSACASRGC
jgi:histidine triad (HIT) family protein